MLDYLWVVEEFHGCIREWVVHCQSTGSLKSMDSCWLSRFMRMVLIFCTSSFSRLVLGLSLSEDFISIVRSLYLYCHQRESQIVRWRQYLQSIQHSADISGNHMMRSAARSSYSSSLRTPSLIYTLFLSFLDIYGCICPLLMSSYWLT